MIWHLIASQISSIILLILTLLKSHWYSCCSLEKPGLLWPQVLSSCWCLCWDQLFMGFFATPSPGLSAVFSDNPLSFLQYHIVFSVFPAIVYNCLIYVIYVCLPQLEHKFIRARILSVCSHRTMLGTQQAFNKCFTIIVASSMLAVELATESWEWQDKDEKKVVWVDVSCFTEMLTTESCRSLLEGKTMPSCQRKPCLYGHKNMKTIPM